MKAVGLLHWRSRNTKLPSRLVLRFDPIVCATFSRDHNRAWDIWAGGGLSSGIPHLAEVYSQPDSLLEHVDAVIGRQRRRFPRPAISQRQLCTLGLRIAKISPCDALMGALTPQSNNLKSRQMRFRGARAPRQRHANTTISVCHQTHHSSSACQPGLQCCSIELDTFTYLRRQPSHCHQAKQHRLSATGFLSLFTDRDFTYRPGFYWHITHPSNSGAP